MNKNQKKEMNEKLSKEVIILTSSLLVLAVVGILLYFFWPKGKVEEASTPIPVDIKLTREYNHKLGPDSAKVKIVEFYDPECEACAAFYPHVKEIMDIYKNDVQLIVRYALYHGNSLLAAKASDAAALQGKFWEYQAILFVKQAEWSHKEMPATVYFEKYAKELNLDINKFKNDMDDLQRMVTINEDIEDGKKIGVNGTPTFFINGTKLTHFSPESFKISVKYELEKK